MAKAEPIFEPTPMRVPDGVILTLTKDEAQTLKAILARVGGDVNLTRRRHAHMIDNALYSAGFAAHDTSDIQPGTLYFEKQK